MTSFAHWLASTSASMAIQKTLWLVPVMQTIHIVCVAMVFTSVVMIEFRILGISKAQTMAQTAHRFVPWIFYGVVVLALTGAVLIVGEPGRSLPSFEFQAKMLFLAVGAGADVCVRDLRAPPRRCVERRCQWPSDRERARHRGAARVGCGHHLRPVDCLHGRALSR